MVRDFADCNRGARTAIVEKLAKCVSVVFMKSVKMLARHSALLKLGNSHCDVALHRSLSRRKATNENIHQCSLPPFLLTNKFHFRKTDENYGSKY